MNLTCLSPLKWPLGYQRTPSDCIRWSQFGGASYKRPTVAAALENLRRQISAFTRAGHPYRTSDVVVTANLRTGAHGLFRSDQAEPADRGVALYFLLDGKQLVFACDHWNRVGCNLQAIAKTLEAMRGIDRWGVTECDRAFTGFAALPFTTDTETPWQILGLACTKDVAAIDAAYKVRAKTAHPDLGGSHEAMTKLNTARDQAIAFAQTP